MSSASAQNIQDAATLQLSASRLNEAAWLDDVNITALCERFNVEKGSVLHHGMINKESGSVLISAAGMQSRYFVIDVDAEWRPRLSYYKQRFHAPGCKPECRPEAAGSFDLISFSFTPTKKARSSENLRSWRLDFNTAANSAASANKRDKLVLEFSSNQDCYEWQVALSLCKKGLQYVTQERLRKSSQAGSSFVPPTIAAKGDAVFATKPHSSSSSSPSFHSSEAHAASNAHVLSGQSLALDVPASWTPDLSCLLSTVVLHNLYMSAPENRPDASKHGASDSFTTDSVDCGRPSVVAHANYVKRRLEAQNMFLNHSSDQSFDARCSDRRQHPSFNCLGWSFSDSACDLFSSLAADSAFYNHFRVAGSNDIQASAIARDLALSEFSDHNVDVAAYVHSKIMPSTCVEHTNIMYWTDRFHLCETELDAREYDDRKSGEGRALIWPYIRASYNDVNEFCSFISLYIFQSARDIALDPLVVSENVHDYVHGLVYTRCTKACARPADDELISAQCRRFKSLTLDDIGLERNLQPSTPHPFASSIQLLLDMLSLTSPRLKLKLVLECSRSIAQELEDSASAHDAATRSSVSKHPSDSVCYITADEFIGVFNYVLIQSNIPTLATQLQYIRQFSSKNDLFGESGYFLSTLEASTSWLQTLNDESLAALKKNQ